MPHLDPASVDRIWNAVVHTRIERKMLLARIDPIIVGMMPLTRGGRAEQLRLDIYALNGLPTPEPLMQWLSTAAALVGVGPEVDTFMAIRSRLKGVPYRPLG